MNVLVLGGTTFFGRAIVEQLLTRGDEVTVFSRGNTRPEWWGNVGHVNGDRANSTSLEQLRGRAFDAVIDNIAYTGADVDMLLNIIGPSIGHYVLTSSSAVYNTARGFPPYDEDDVDRSFRPPAEKAASPGWAYTIGKLTAEQVLIDRDDVVWTIIRPPIVLGPNDPTLRGWFYFQRLLDGGPLLFRCCAERSFRIVYSEDLARGYLGALDTPVARGQIYNITQQEVVRMRDFLAAAADGLGVPLDIVDITVRDLAHMALEYSDPYDRLSNFIPSVERAERDLGYVSTPFKDWVGETARWYRDRYDGADSQGYEARDDEILLARGLRSYPGGSVKPGEE